MAKKKSQLSDKDAKSIFKNYLIKQGFEIKKWNKGGKCPADIYACHNDKEFYFEIKKTSLSNKRNNYFGAATLNEWTAAVENPHNYFFVIAFEKGNDYDFYIITPQKFIKYLYIPSFKIYFNIPYDVNNQQLLFFKPGREGTSIVMNDEVYHDLRSCWEKLNEKSYCGQEKTQADSEFKLVDTKKSLLEQIMPEGTVK